MKKLFFAFVAVLMVTTSALAAKHPSVITKVDQKEMNSWVEATFKKLTPEQRIAQLIVMAVNPRDSRANETVKKYIGDYQIGGLIYNENDIETQVKLTNYAQSLANVPLLITLDAEWGLSMRLEDAPKFPRNLFLGAVGDDQLFYEYGKEIARECKRIGVNVNFAPVLDVIDRKHTVIGTRAYGSNPEVVARHGIAFARGMEDGGVLSVMKHFPGHGSTTADSHKELPLVDKSMSELKMFDFVPFQRYIDAGLGGALTGHLHLSAIDKNPIPGTMSKKYVTDLLQKKMGFKGLVFTDALGMEGAKAVGGSVCVGAFLAGNDILLMPDDLGKEIEALKQAVATGKIKQKDIDARVKKVLRFKYALGLSQKQQVELHNVVADVNAPCATVLQRRLTAASITVVKDDYNMLPISNLPAHHIAVVTMGNDNGKKSMFARRCNNYAETTSFEYREGQSVDALKTELKNGKFDIVIVSVAKENQSLISAAKQLVQDTDNAIVAVMGHPEHLDIFGSLMGHKNVKAALVAYSNTQVNEDYLAQTIFGGNSAQGILPLDVEIGNGHKFLAGTGYRFYANRLGYTIPAEVGFNSNLTLKIDSICRYGVQQHAFPGCQVVVARHGKVVFNRAYGDISFESNIPVDVNTLYGLASVSKATGTLSAVMKTYDDGKFTLDQPASDFIPGLKGTDKEDITFEQLLYHETGMPPSLNMWQMMMDPKTYSGKLITEEPNEYNTIKIMHKAYGNKFAKLRTDILSTVKTDEFNLPIADGIWGSKATYDSIMTRIYNANLGKKRYLYSCLNFSLLANAMQNINHAQLNDFVQSKIFGPLGAYHTMYRPLDKYASSEIAYTEVDTYLRRQHIHGYVHDELAAFSGGVQGNAGLFSNANDLAKLFQMWLNGGTYGGQRFLKESTVRLFLDSKSENSHRGLGFDKPVVDDPDRSSTCPEATPETVGHTGFTGTCFWVDPANDMIYVFLSNRVCPTRSNPNFGRVSARSHIQSILYKSIIQ